jgi:H-type small acid-soluble spore protein
VERLDTQSAIQIVNSPNEIKVLYQGAPVWIQGVNGSIARIKFLEGDRVDEVSVHELTRADEKK